MKDIIKIESLVKRFGDFVALNNINLTIKEGELFGILGPNGAGKTTTINIIATLTKPTEGRVIVNGYDVVKNPEGVKKTINVMTQETIVEPDLTARQNLDLFARLYGITDKAERERKVMEGLERADLVRFADRYAGSFSGGMQRRLALSMSLINDPKIIILDEPTVGLDVQNRVRLWEEIKKLNKEENRTVILTTQYLEEADALCDRIAIIDHGQIKAIGTATELKKLVSKSLIIEIIPQKDYIEKVSSLLKEEFEIEINIENERITALYEGDPLEIAGKITDLLRRKKIPVNSFSIRLPTMDDVFIKLTGASLRDSASESNNLRANIMARR
ncbi:MAG: putative ABC transporter ATP-binding protein [Candidatus Micrarchaeota archaeon]|nr:MAG: putative ABC transporter ATP-binding protein [Candidatus Micrarchaeota archaeon]